MASEKDKTLKGKIRFTISRKYFTVFVITAAILIIAFLSIGYNVYKVQIRREAVSVANEVVAFRHWIAKTSVVSLNSPAAGCFAIREFSQIYAAMTAGTTFRITSDDFRNPSNKSDGFELESINSFRADKSLKYVEAFEGGVYRYSQPLKVTEVCLKCHGKPEDAPKEVIETYGHKAFGYKLGDIRGVITVNVPQIGIAAAIKTFASAITLAVFLLAGALALNFIWFKKNIIQPMNSIDLVMKGVGGGNYDKRIDIRTNDEFSDLAATFNETMDTLAKYIRTEEDAKKIQETIIGFLNLLSTASEGDLTVRADVTPDVFGSVGDAFNFMVEGLTDLIDKVKKSADRVNNETERLIPILAEMADGAEKQTVEVRNTTEAIDESLNATFLIADKTDKAQKVSDLALDSIDRGDRKVKDSIEGMQNIRTAIQSVNKRMKYLSERLMEIATISHIIAEVSDRTNLLALNASIEAARAKEHGKGFVVIAEEIKGLAERSAKSTRQIDEIVSSILKESAVVTRHLEDETQYVEQGTKAAMESGAVFKEIDASIRDMVKAISDINASVDIQKGVTKRVVSSMDEVQRVSLQILRLSRDFNAITKAFSDISDRIMSSVSRFKL
ncbi:MAG: methyl-accepting chemotaxis protein [Nitrospirae bacterium]|nr:methyl-accepting chemotaxis protein [Nitrospirota bacterium]